MSFDGPRLVAVNGDVRNAAKPATRMETATQRLRRAFALFQRTRKNNPLLKISGEQQQGSDICGCGQLKKHSAKYCFACSDAKHILKQKLTASEYTGFHQTEREPRVVHTPNNRVPDKISCNYEEDREIDRLVNIYERELSSYG